MSTVGTIVRDPGIVWLPIANSSVTITRGQLVTVDASTHTARLTATGDRIFGIASSDSDPDLLSVAVAAKGGYTISVVVKAGDAVLVGTPLFQDQTTFSQATITSTASKALGWAVNGSRDSLGNIEMAFFLDVEA